MRYLIALLLTIITAPAFAEGSVGAPAYQYTAPMWGLSGQAIPAQTSPSAACNYGHSTNPYTATKRSYNTYECLANGATSSSLHSIPICTSTTLVDQSGEAMCRSQSQTCPTGSTLTAGQCVCNSGLKPFNGQCVVPKCETKDDGNFDEATMSDMYAASMPSLASACVGGCYATPVVVPAKDPACRIVGGVKQCKYKFGYTRTGGGNADACTAGEGGVEAPKTTEPTPPESCGAGQGMIKIDGATKCINTSTGKEVPTTPPTSNTQTTNQTTTQNPNGTTTVTKTTTNTATGGTTTVTEVYGPGVTPGGSTPPISTTTGTTGGGAGGTGSGTGNGTDDQGKGSCGGSGQPPCKIDETGTPTDGDLSEQHTAYDQASQAREESITAIGSGQQVTELPWTWTPSFPTGSCQNLDFDIGGGKGAVIDVCSSSHLQTARQLWGWLLYMLFAVYAWKRFTGSVERD